MASSSIPVSVFREAIIEQMTETFHHGNIHYLDPGSSLFETLANVSSATASQSASNRVGTLAAQIDHIAYYIEVLLVHAAAGGDDPTYEADWSLAWQRTSVTDAEWAELIENLGQKWREFRQFVETTEDWNADLVAGAMAVVSHSAYHLGEVRQALGVIPESSPGE
ncbi:MAG: DinB family protein [Thermomicrobiales bacterium]